MLRTTLLVATLLVASAPATPVHAAAAAPAGAAFVAVGLARDAGDEQYRFLVGLCEQGLFELAVKEGERFLAEHPRHAKVALARYRLATALFELGRTADARTHLVRLARERDFELAAEVLFRLGQCELAEERFDEARKAFARCLDEHANATGNESRAAYLRVPATFFAGEAAFRAGDFEAAETAYAQVEEHAEASSEYAPLASYGRTWCALRRGEHDRAAERAERFLARHAGHELASEVRFVLGEALLEAGQHARALAAYDAVDGGPFHDAALRGAGFARAALGDHAGAARAFAELLERFPQSAFRAEAALHRGIALLEGGDARGAAAALGSKDAGEGAETLYWLARAQAAGGAPQDALATSERALAARPAQELETRVRTLRGDLLFELGRHADATAEYERSRSDYALHAAAIASLNDGRATEAERLARALLERFPESDYALRTRLALGEALLARDRHAEAEAAFAAALAGAGDAPGEKDVAVRALARIGWCRLLAGDDARAAEAFATLLERFPAAPEAAEARFARARALSGAGDAGGAAAEWRRFLELHPEDANVPEALLLLGRLEEGTERLERLLARHADSPFAQEALYELAEKHARAGRTDVAARRYEEQLQRFPEGALAPAARYGLAWCRYGAGRHADALALLALVERDAQDAELATAAVELSIWSARAAGDVDAAAAAWRRLAQRTEDDARLFEAVRVVAAGLREADRAADADALLAELEERARDGAVALGVLVERTWTALERDALEEAAQRLAQARAAAPDDARVAEAAVFVGEAFYERGDDARAVQCYAAAAAAKESAVADDALYKQGFAQLRAGDAAAAEATFARLVEAHADSDVFGEGLFLLGEARFRQGRWAEAVEPLARLRDEAPDHEVMPKALFRLGLALGQLARWKESEAALAELARAHPTFENGVEADLWRGRALANQGNARAARQAFDRVVARDKGVLAARARLEIGRLHVAAGRTEDALSEFLKVALLYAHAAEVSEAHWLAGRCLETLGDPQKAADQYREILAKYPESELAGAARDRLREMESL